MKNKRRWYIKNLYYYCIGSASLALAIKCFCDYIDALEKKEVIDDE